MLNKYSNLISQGLTGSEWAEELGTKVPIDPGDGM